MRNKYIPKDVLVVGDVHAHPDHDNSRARLLGNFISDRKPHSVVQVGDMEDMPSLCSYDFGKKSHEGARYWRDVEAVIDFLTELDLVIKPKLKKEIDWRLLGGNHGEGRINKVLNNDAKIEELLSIEHFRYTDFGWKYTPFLEMLNLDGLFFTHYVTNKLGKAISSTTNVGKAILNHTNSPVLVGHSHELNLYRRATASGQILMAGDVGCFFDYEVDYVNKNVQDGWARGVLLLKNVQGEYVPDYEWVSLETLKRDYN